MEVEPAALTVHAPIYTASTSDLDINGDFTLRDNFHTCMKKIFAMSNFNPKKILDVGCSTGLSTLKLHDSFPGAEIIGMDLSPYMLAGTLHNCFLSLILSLFLFSSLLFYSHLFSMSPFEKI
jgi:SAM-dependent methyltransferase